VSGSKGPVAGRATISVLRGGHPYRQGTDKTAGPLRRKGNFRDGLLAAVRFRSTVFAQLTSRMPVLSRASATFAGGCLAALLLVSTALGAPPFRTEPYAWKSVHIGGGGFVTGIVFHPAERGLAYVRTDVGGAYRWDAPAGRWVQLIDFLGLEDANLTGIESLAIDPQDPERIFLAAGTYTNARAGNGAMLLSADRGRTFQRVDLPFKMGANEAGRGNGERLVVDPHDSRVLLFGSRAAGLWRSADRGLTWRNVKTFPAAATSGDSISGDQWKQPVGIVWLQFDPRGGKPGTPTALIYAAISTREGGVYRSSDAGHTWEPLPGQPKGLRPTRSALAPDGTLYLAYGNDPGPNTMTDGAVWKFSPADVANPWTDLTPLRSDKQPRTGFGYGAIALDPSNPQTLLTATFCRWDPRDEIFRSTDGGRTWKPLLATSQWDVANSPWAEHHRAHWISDVKIDPFDRDHALFTTGYGLWASRDLASSSDNGQSVQWWFKNDGLEETVPLGLISPPEGAPLLSALGDLDGFKHDDLEQAPLQFSGPPRFANSEDIAFAGERPSVIVRAGTIRNRTDQVRAAYSKDGGATWKAFATEPPDSHGGGRVTISADGDIVVWKPARTAAHVTRDFGETWALCQGLGVGVALAFDRADPKTCYAFDGATGTLLVSTDGGAIFKPRASDLPKTSATPGGFGGGTIIRTVPGQEGELWLASREHGLFHSTDTGATFAASPSVTNAYSLGFGHAAEGRSEPALYLFGKVGGTTGLFRSDDSGSTWTRINDDLHQFGWVNHVTGDPRRYGRVYFATGGRGIFYGDPATPGSTH
jgi:photosystem II stability/assembly factor-like uncharacterized protein